MSKTVDPFEMPSDVVDCNACGKSWDEPIPPWSPDFDQDAKVDVVLRFGVWWCCLADECDARKAAKDG